MRGHVHGLSVIVDTLIRKPGFPFLVLDYMPEITDTFSALDAPSQRTSRVQVAVLPALSQRIDYRRNGVEHLPILRIGLRYDWTTRL